MEIIPVDAMTNFANIVAMIEGAILSNRRTLNGLIIEAPGSRNLRSNARDRKYLRQILDLALEKGIPISILGQPMQPFHKHGVSQAVYMGSADLLGGPIMPGGELMSTEAKIVMSIALREAQTAEMNPSETITHVREAIKKYVLYIHSSIAA